MPRQHWGEFFRGKKARRGRAEVRGLPGLRKKTAKSPSLFCMRRNLISSMQHIQNHQKKETDKTSLSSRPLSAPGLSVVSASGAWKRRQKPHVPLTWHILWDMKHPGACLPPRKDIDKPPLRQIPQRWFVSGTPRLRGGVKAQPLISPRRQHRLRSIVSWPLRLRPWTRLP